MMGSTKIEIDGYTEYGHVPGGFVTAVMCGDLFAAHEAANPANWESLAEIIEYVRERVPNGAWGSKEKMSAWLMHCGLKGWESREAA